MDKDNRDSDLQSSQETDKEQSIVGKLKKNVSNIISHTPISKWFRMNNSEETPTAPVRRRQEDSDDEQDLRDFQPPTKRTKLQENKEALNVNMSHQLSPIVPVSSVQCRHFPEPIAGPSGHQSRKLTNILSFPKPDSYTKNSNSNRINAQYGETSTDLHNNSDSEESVGGSSLEKLENREVISQESSKRASPIPSSTLRSRSLFANSGSSRLFNLEESISGPRSASVSSRMPSFDSSVIGSSSIVDRTLSSRKILSSPFYNGFTIYGGASAYGRNTKRSSRDIQKVLRKSVSIKPKNTTVEKSNLQLSKTAKRILDTLEQYSSPVSDSKKVPVASKKFKSDGLLTKYIGANPYTLRESRGASNMQLQVPSVTDLLKMKMEQQKAKLQNSTETARQIATQATSTIEHGAYQMPTFNKSEKYTAKMKNKITSVRRKPEVVEPAPEVNLTPVILPIKELPKFDFSVPPPVQKLKPTQTCTSVTLSEASTITLSEKSYTPVNKETIKSAEKSKDFSTSAEESSSEFQFSAPLVLAECLKPLKTLNNFKFSEPLVKKRRSIHPELDQETKAFDISKNKRSNGEIITSAKETDVFMDKFKPKNNTWECSVCLIRNELGKTKCVACESMKPSEISLVGRQPSVTTPISFKPPENTWECPTCMIRNKDDLTKCAACNESKPGKTTSTSTFHGGKVTTEAPKLLGDMFKTSTTTLNNGSSNVNVKSSPLKFTAPSNTWECPTCLIRNKNELLKCLACETAKPQTSKAAQPASQPSPVVSNTFSSDFKKKEDEWECAMCMVRNKASLDKCQCCEAPCPNMDSLQTKKMPSFNFGVTKDTSGFTFGIPPGAQAISKPTISLVFGNNKKNQTTGAIETPKFSFGIPPSTSSNKSDQKSDEKTTESVQKLDQSPVTFKLDSKPKTSEPTKSQSIPTFSFGSVTKSAESTPDKLPAPSITIGSANKGNDSTLGKTTDIPGNLSLDSSAKVDASKSAETSLTNLDKAKEIDKTPSLNFAKSNEKTTNQQQQLPTAPSFNFGAANKTNDTVTTAPAFSFGAPNKNDSTTGAPAPTFTFGQKTDSASADNSGNATKINPLLKPTEKLPEKAPIASAEFSFGLAKSPNQIGSGTLKRDLTSGSPTKRSRTSSTDGAPQTKIPSFSFGSSSTNGDVASTFGKMTEQTKPVSDSVGFAFGSGKPTETTPGLGSLATKEDTLSNQTSTAFKFNSSTNGPSKPTNGFSFGSPSTLTGFGSKMVDKPAFSYGSDTLPSAQPTASKTGLFPFGGSSSENKPPVFAFNASATPAADSKTTATGQFNPTFGSTASTAPPPFGMKQSTVPSFSFGSNQKLSTTTPAAFGANVTSNSSSNNNKPEPLFGSASNLNGTFNFGSAANSNQQKAGFSFGASATGGSEAAASRGGFSFGSAANSNAPEGGGFAFSASGPSAPNFNFTGGSGIMAFSAQPQQGSDPPRKFKKAIRRTAR